MSDAIQFGRITSGLSGLISAKTMNRNFLGSRTMLQRALRFGLGPLGLTFLLAGSPSAQAGDTLSWRTNDNRVSADIKSTELTRVLEKVATVTGWQVFLEPDA